MTELPASVELHCETMGHGPNLVILHGLFGSGENWRSQAKRLAESFTVHSMDARNHGDSPHTSSISYPEMAADVITTCASMGIERTHLLGHSMGGKTAMQLALLHPQLLDNLIIVDIGPGKYPHHHQSVLQGLAAVEASDISSRRDADNTLARHVDNAAIRSFLLKNLQRQENKSYQLKINLKVITEQYEHIAAAVDKPAKPFEGPVLFIKGADSDYLKTADRNAILKQFPKAALKSIDGAGHWPHSEKPDVVFKIISDFFTDK